MASVRQLCWDYRAALSATSDVERDLTETFYPVPKYQQVMDQLEVLHARPDGIILLAKLEGTPIGCGMTQRLDDSTCEIKRVFTSPLARGKGAARAICLRLMDQARRDGYARLVLDTSINLKAAQQLYTSLGFAKRGPYQPIPDAVLPHMMFFETPLGKDIS